MGLLNWYSGLLKSRPLVANLGSAFVVMSVGDIMAQEIEIHKQGGKSENRLSRRSSSSLITPKQPELLRNSMTRNHPRDSLSSSPEGIISSKAMTPLSSTLLSSLEETIYRRIKSAKHELQRLDYIRTGTMVFWSVGIYTPFYMRVFKLFDKHLPKKVTFATISTRVITCFLLSIPINAVFFVYGSCVHQLIITSRRSDGSTTTDESKSNNNLWNEIIKLSKQKLNTELYNTIVTSGKVWIPFNFILFTFVPPHLRPLNLMVCSAFWNCYLSLVQHR